MLKPKRANKKGKYFIDYDREIRECRDCRKIKPFKEFRKNSTGIYPETWCKVCKNIYIVKYNQSKKPRFKEWGRK